MTSKRKRQEHRTGISLTDPGIRAAVGCNRSFWALRYMDGRLIGEWWEVDWADTPTKGRQALRLYCPNGKFAEVGLGGADATDRLFQLKQAEVDLGVGLMGLASLSNRRTTAHIIGCIYGLNGECICYAWDYTRRLLVGPWDDNVHGLRYGGIGQLAQDVLGIKAD